MPRYMQATPTLTIKVLSLFTYAQLFHMPLKVKVMAYTALA